MFGKPIATATRGDLDRLIADRVPEGRHLEFKDDIPVSAEEQKKQRRDDANARPIDRSWVSGKSLMSFGRDSLMEELVAFANAGGGVIVLGMEETAEAPPRASKINPLPDVAGLERRFRDFIVDTVEPRLPYAAVKAIPTQPDGSGILLLETAPSTLGPHWVRGTRKATIRREDRCDPLSMTEIHDMVLRNSRNFSDLTARLEERSAAFGTLFKNTLLNEARNAIGVSPEDRIHTWLSQAGKVAFGLRVTLIAHQQLGIPRIERLSGYVPDQECIQASENGTRIQIQGQYLLWPSDEGGRRVLGGIEEANLRSNLHVRHTVLRDGFVEVSLITWDEAGRLQVFADWFVSALGAALGIFQNLRQKAGAPAMPAEIGIEILTWRDVTVGRPGPRVLGTPTHPLSAKVSFPRYTVGELADFTDVMNDAIADLMNAGGLTAVNLPKYEYVRDSDA